MKKIMCILATYLLVIVVFGIGEVKATTISSITHNSATIGKYTKYELTFTISPAYTPTSAKTSPSKLSALSSFTTSTRFQTTGYKPAQTSVPTLTATEK